MLSVVINVIENINHVTSEQQILNTTIFLNLVS